MLRVLITGSSDGIGLFAARTLISQGHQVTLHARNAERASQTNTAAPGAAAVLIADISTIDGMKQLAMEANKAVSPFDVVVHNAGIGPSPPYTETSDGFAQLFAVNSLAPYVLTALMTPPKRLVYVSSMLHTGGDGSLKDITWPPGRSWQGFQAYNDSKLHNVMLANAVARRWKEVESNSLNPGWIQTKLGGSSAPGGTQSGADTIVELVAPKASVGTGEYYSDHHPTKPLQAALEEEKQEQLMSIYEKLSGVEFPS